MRSPSKTVAVGFVLVAVLAGCAGGSPRPVMPAAPAATWTEPLPTYPADVQILGATRNAIWASFPTSGQSVERLSRDGGRTWEKWNAGYETLMMSTAGNGWFAANSDEDGMANVRTFSISEKWEGIPLGEWQLAALGSRAALSTQGHLATASSSRKVTFPALPKATPRPTHSFAFTDDSRHVVRITRTKGEADYAGAVLTSSGKATGRVTLPRTSQHRVADSAVYSLSGSRSGLTLCRQPLPSGKASCRLVVKGDRRGVNGTLYQVGAWSLIKDPKSAAPLMVRNGQITTISVPTGTTSWRKDGPGDPTSPLIRVVDAAGLPRHLRVAADGSTADFLTVPRLFVDPFSLEMTQSELLGSDFIGGELGPAWVRSLTAAGPGARRPVAGGEDVVGASGSRWAIRGAKLTYAYDNGRKGVALKKDVRYLSGPYAFGSEGVQTVAGTTVRTSKAEAIFGSLVAERVAALPNRPGFTVRIRDLAKAASKPMTVRLDTSTAQFTWVRMWGDWIGFTAYSPSMRTVLTNVRTGKQLKHAGELLRLGDGYSVLINSRNELVVWSFATGKDIALGAGTSSLYVAAEGNRVAYVKGTNLIVRTLPGVGISRARLLGVLTSGKATKSSPWKAALDLTKPLRAGIVVIRHSDGRIVRTLTTAASASGSVRGLSWDGTTTGGTKVGKGTYRWELITEAVDGSGAAAAVSGKGTPSGSITVG